MKEFVLDNSVVLSWFFEDESAPLSKKALDLLHKTKAHVPSMWPYELSNSLYVAEKTKRVAEGVSRGFINNLKVLPIIIHNNSYEIITNDVLSISREHSITVYDASYLELALRKKLKIATFDKALIKVCQEIGIGLI